MRVGGGSVATVTRLRARQLTPFQSGDPTFDRWQRDLIAIVNPFLRQLSEDARGFFDAETPAGSITGTTGSDGNALFFLEAIPNPPESLILVKTRAVMIPDVDFTLDGNRITFLAPQIPIASPADTLLAWYRSA